MLSAITRGAQHVRGNARALARATAASGVPMYSTGTALNFAAGACAVVGASVLSSRWWAGRVEAAQGTRRGCLLRYPAAVQQAGDADEHWVHGCYIDALMSAESAGRAYNDVRHFLVSDGDCGALVKVAVECGAVPQGTSALEMTCAVECGQVLSLIRVACAKRMLGGRVAAARTTGVASGAHASLEARLQCLQSSAVGSADMRSRLQAWTAYAGSVLDALHSCEDTRAGLACDGGATVGPLRLDEALRALAAGEVQAAVDALDVCKSWDAAVGVAGRVTPRLVYTSLGFTWPVFVGTRQKELFAQRATGTRVAAIADLWRRSAQSGCAKSCAWAGA